MVSPVLSLSEFKQHLEKSQDVEWKYTPNVEYFWTFQVEAKRQEVWLYLSDTSRFNRELGMAPRHEREEDGQLVISTRMLGFAQEWLEEPWTWIAGRTLAGSRLYRQGMAQHVHFVFHIAEEANTCLVYIYFGWTAASFWWSRFLRMSSKLMKNKFAHNFAALQQRLRQTEPRVLAKRDAPELPQSALARLDQGCEQLIKLNLNRVVISQLRDLIVQADDLDLEPLRLVPLAKVWGCSLGDLMSVALHATRLGLLKISWEVICPHCRGSRFSAGTLGEIPPSGSCGVCVVDFETSDENSIEVVFHVHPSIRKVGAQSFCAAEPAKKAHIKLQQLIGPGQSKKITLPLADGLYRLRQIGVANEIRLQVSSAAPLGPLIVSAAPPNSEIIQTGSMVEVQFDNSTKHRTIFVIEELWWEARSLLPGQVLALPEFRDLFAEEHLDANVKLYLGEQTILFTDIVGSTRFYTRVGDARAFREVRQHFLEVIEQVKMHHGVVVKTIGDAVMASFHSCDQALAAAIAIQKCFPLVRQDTSIRLRISLHTGPVIAVQLNTGIDYFGSTVNFAAKMQAYVDACEIAVSEASHRLSSARSEMSVEQRKGEANVNFASIYVLRVDGSEVSGRVVNYGT